MIAARRFMTTNGDHIIAGALVIWGIVLVVILVINPLAGAAFVVCSVFAVACAGFALGLGAITSGLVSWLRSQRMHV